MRDAVVQAMWAQLFVDSLVAAGIRTCVISPGSRSTPLVTALVADGRLDLPVIIDERAAAFFALGVARAIGVPAAVACTSGSAAAHYLPAIVEATSAAISLVVITADRPPELHHCGATQTIDQVKMYGGFVRTARDVGAPVGTELALRAMRRTVLDTVRIARSPHPGPVHLEVPLRKPLEPVPPTEPDELALAAVVSDIVRDPPRLASPRIVAAASEVEELAQAIANEPRGIIVAGALPATAAARVRPRVMALCARAGYPLLAESSSQLRGRPDPAVTSIDHFDLLLGAHALAGAPAPRLVIRLGAAPVAASWPPAQLLAGAKQWVLDDQLWRDPESSGCSVVIGELADTCTRVDELLRARPHADRADREAFAAAWRVAEQHAAGATDRAMAEHPGNEVAIVEAALAAVPPDSIVQLGNSLPIRVIDHGRASDQSHTVIAQRGAAGIDGMIASAAGATRAGRPVLAIIGDVSFAHDLAALVAAREASAPLAILVIDNAGGRIFEGLPIARARLGAAFERCFLTPPSIDVCAVAEALGARTIRAGSPRATRDAVADALTNKTAPWVTVIHAPVTPSGAHDVRRHALELVIAGASHA
jgi:2-succinyl-5-enolpyruvyl-6-hydroxy-3-cyclohexene-1-carboxylate synthase